MTESGQPRVEGCDAENPSRYIGPDGKTVCRCIVCGRCGHHTGNSHQGHYWSFCAVTRTQREFHFCCPGNCQLEATTVMSTLTRDITTETTASGVGFYKRWRVASDAGSVVLTLLRQDGDPSESIADHAAVTGLGHWVRCGFAWHHRVAEPAWGCPLHAGCDFDAVSRVWWEPAWDAIVAAEFTDEAIFAELESLHRDEWPGGESA